MTKKQARCMQRLAAAMQLLSRVEEELLFEEISVVLHDHTRHWMFYFRKQLIASYWPSSAKGQIQGVRESQPCASAPKAQRLAITAKQQFLSEVAAAMRGV